MTHTMENLLKLMRIPTSVYESVVRTADGMYIARRHGDIWYTQFLGKPTPPRSGPGRDFMLRVWNGLTIDEKRAVVALANNPAEGEPIPLKEDFGVPVEEVDM